MITAQGCYTQMVVERRVVITPDRQVVDTIYIVEDDYSLVHEYKYWFADHRYYANDWTLVDYGYYQPGVFVDISWYDPFYSPGWCGSPYPYYDPWYDYGYSYYGHGYGCRCHGYNHHQSGWWTGNYGGHHGGHGYNEPQPPKKPRDWERRGNDDFTGGIQRGTTPSSSGVILTGTTPIWPKTGNERPSLTRKSVESTKTTKIEKSRESKGFEIKRTKKNKSSSGDIKRKETKSNKSKSVRPSKTTKKDKSARPSKPSKSRETKVTKTKSKSSRSTRKPNRG